MNNCAIDVREYALEARKLFMREKNHYNAVLVDGNIVIQQTSKDNKTRNTVYSTKFNKGFITGDKVYCLTNRYPELKGGDIYEIISFNPKRNLIGFKDIDNGEPKFNVIFFTIYTLEKYLSPKLQAFLRVKLREEMRQIEKNNA